MSLRLYTGEYLISPVPLHFGMNWCTHHCFYCFANLNNPHRRADNNDLGRIAKWYRAGRGPIEYWYLSHGHPMLVANDADPFAKSNLDTFTELHALSRRHGFALTYQTKGGDREAEDRAIDGPPTMFAVTLTSDDDAKLAEIEPGAPGFAARLDLIRRAKAAGHHVFVAIAPFVAAWWRDFEGAIAAMKDAGVRHAWLGALHFSRYQIGAMSESVKTRFATEIDYGMGRNKRDMGELNHLRDLLLDAGINVFHGGGAEDNGFWDEYYARFPFYPTLDAWFKRLDEAGQGKIVCFSQADLRAFCDIGQPQNLSIYKEYVVKFARSIRNQIAADPVHNGWRSRHEKARSSADVIDAFWRVFDYPTPLRHENLATPICGVETDTTVIVDEAERLPMLAYVPGGSRDDLVKVSRSNAVIYGEKGGT